jgi:ribosome-binding factor A
MPAKRTSHRVRRVADQIQRELAELLRQEVKDPRVGSVTVTAVDVTSDFAHANVHFTTLEGQAGAKETLAALARTTGFLRSALSRRIDLYAVPQLHFVYDASVEQGMRLSALIDQAVASDKAHPHDEDPA